MNSTPPDDLKLREVTEADLATLFEQQQDPAANWMAAFTAKDPNDRPAFAAKWARILGDPTVIARVVECRGRVVGNVGAFMAPWSGQREVTYWIGREHWGQGIATRALTALLGVLTERPLHARAAADNRASIRVLEKCGFMRVGGERGFAEARGEEIDEVVMELRAGAPDQSDGA
ncbi:MAG: GNAT family N-acetyltransferase [Candidatus Eisenbacteria bacterium]